jgi:hypothetical protein
MKRVDYWKLKNQAAAAESAADTYPSGHCPRRRLAYK